VASTPAPTTTFARATFLPGSTQVILDFDVVGISYVKLAENGNTFIAVRNAIQEGIAHIAASSSPEFMHIASEHVEVKISSVPEKSDAIQVHAAISSPRETNAMLLWSKMVALSAELARTVEAKISFADGIGPVATGPISIDGGIMTSSHKATTTTVPSTTNFTMAVGIASGARQTRSQALLVAMMVALAVGTGCWAL